TAVNDLGLRARLRDGKRGFRITVGGGTAIMCRDGGQLHDFVPSAEIFVVAEAVVRVFHKHGDREHRQRNRLKFLIKTLGWEGFLAEYAKAHAAAKAEAAGRIETDLDAV